MTVVVCCQGWDKNIKKRRGVSLKKSKSNKKKDDLPVKNKNKKEGGRRTKEIKLFNLIFLMTLYSTVWS